MPNKLREYHCIDCGALTRRSRKSNAPRICIECGVKRAVRWNEEQIAESIARTIERDNVR